VIFSVLLGQKCTRLEKNFCLVSISTAGCARHLGIEPNHKVLRPKVLNHNPPATARQLIFPSCYVPQLVLCANGHAKLYCLPIAIIIAKCSLKPHSSTKLFCHGASGSKHPRSRHQDVHRLNQKSELELATLAGFQYKFLAFMFVKTKIESGIWYPDTSTRILHLPFSVQNLCFSGKIKK